MNAKIYNNLLKENSVFTKQQKTSLAFVSSCENYILFLRNIVAFLQNLLEMLLQRKLGLRS